MVSIAQHRRDVPLPLSQMGIDEELLKDVLRRVRERRARTHPLPTPRLHGSHRVALGHNAGQKQAFPGVSPTKRYSYDTWCMDFPCMDILGMQVKSRRNHLLRIGSAVEDDAVGRTAAPREQRDSASIRSIHYPGHTTASAEQRDSESTKSLQSRRRTTYDQIPGSPSMRSNRNPNFRTSAVHPEQRDAESIGATHSLHSRRTTRYDQIPGSPSMRSNRNPNFKNSSAEMHRLSPRDRSIAWGSPGVSPSVGSRINGFSNRNLASRAPTASVVGNKRVSKPFANQSGLNPRMRKEGHLRAVHAAQQGSSKSVRSNLDLHSQQTSRNKQASKKAVIHPKTRNQQASALPDTRSKFNPSRTPSVRTARNKQASKPSGTQSGLNPNFRKEGHGRAGELHATEQDDSNAIGSNRSIHSKKSTRNKAPGIQSIFQGKKWRQGQVRAGSVGKDGSSSVFGSTGTPSSSKQTNRSLATPPMSQTIQREGWTRKMPGMSSSIRSSSNALYDQSYGSQASTTYSSTGQGTDRRVGRDRGNDAKSTSPRDMGVFLQEMETSRSFDSEGDSVSTLSMPSMSTAQTRNSTRTDLRSVYPGDRNDSQDDDGDTSSGNESSEGSHTRTTSRESREAIDSVRSTSNVIASSQIDDVLLKKAVLKTIAESNDLSFDELIEMVCDKLDELDETLLRCNGSKRAPRQRKVPRLQPSENW